MKVVSRIKRQSFLSIAWRSKVSVLDLDNCGDSSGLPYRRG